MLVDQGNGILCAIHTFSRQHFVEDDAEAVQIATRVQNLARTLLRAHVIRRAEDLTMLGQLRFFRYDFGDAEI